MVRTERDMISIQYTAVLQHSPARWDVSEPYMAALISRALAHFTTRRDNALLEGVVQLT